jgi:peptidoglycan/LPS O-acetylase OafA/YrhL
MPTTGTRADIQSLRGYAVLVVVLFHAQIVPVSAGYIGVDIFFVISGFLMTRLVLDAVDDGQFRFGAFYFRRAKRLLPALYVVTALVALAAPFVLTSLELRWLRGQIAGALSFTANILLARQSGYFDGEAALKPLLHIWSLSLEEQFYLLLPALLVVLPRRSRVAVLAAGVAVSYAVSQQDLELPLTFYGLPSRAWELLLGAVGAAWMQRQSQGATPTGGPGVRLLVALALLLLLAAPLHALPWPHPGPLAAIAGAATLIVLLAGSPLLDWLTPLQWLGDRSYSLYLVHWPLFAFFENVWMGPSAGRDVLLAKSGILVASLLATELLYRFVERPIHRAPLVPTRRVVFAGLGATAVLGAFGYVQTTVRGDAHDYAFDRRRNVGMDPSCDNPAGFVARPACRNSETPVLLLWGDSFAMHLAPGLLAPSGTAVPMVQATKSSCAPLLGVALRDRPGGPRSVAEDCLAFNDSVLALLDRTASITTVVLSSPFAYYVQPGGALRVRSADGTVGDVQTSVAATLDGLRATVTAIRARGRRAVLVGPTPSDGIDVARCAERVMTGLLTFGERPGCDIATAGLAGLSPDVEALLLAAPRALALPVISLTDALCDASRCTTMDAEGSLYRDASHLSHRGSVVVATRLRLAARVIAEAR